MSNQVSRRRTYGTFTPSQALSALAKNTGNFAYKAMVKKATQNVINRATRRTKTGKPKSKPDRFALVKEGHGDITYSKTVISRKPNKSEKRLASTRGKILRRYNTTVEINGQAGRQTSYSFVYHELEQLKTMVTDVAATLPTPESTKTSNMEPFLHKSNHCLTVTNFANTSQTTTIFDLVARVDTSEYPDVAWQRGVFQQGDSEATPGTLPVGSHPRHSKLFNDKWKIEKTTQLQLRPGETHKHFIDCNLNRKVPHSRMVLSDGSTQENFLAGITRISLIVSEGTLASSDTTFPSTCKTAVGVMWTRNYSYSANMAAIRVNYSSGILGQPSDLRAIQPDGDIVTPSSA